MKCCIIDCFNNSRHRNLCVTHYLRLIRHGNVNILLRKKNGSGTITKSGYKLIYNGKKQNYEHRIIMEKILKRKLLRTEIIHHIDGNGLNNAINNLQITEHGLHTKFHHATTFRNKTHKQCTHCKKIKPRWQFNGCSYKGKFADPNSPKCRDCNFITSKKH